MKQLRWTRYLISLIYIALGALIIARPNIVGVGFCVELAITLAIIGLASIIAYLMTKVEDTVTENNNGLAYGIILCVLAVFIMMQQELVIALIPFILGLMITVRGVMMIQHIINLRRLGFQGLGLNVVLAILVIIYGIVIMMYPYQTAQIFFIIMGVGLVFSGIVDLVDNFLLGKQLKKFQKVGEAIRDDVIAAMEQDLQN